MRYTDVLKISSTILKSIEDRKISWNAIKYSEVCEISWSSCNNVLKYYEVLKYP